MANADNKCSELNIPDEYSDLQAKGDHGSINYFNDPFQKMLDKQQSLQEDVYFPKLPDHVSYAKKKFKDMSIKELKDFWLTNSHAMTDEVHEMFDALGGIDNGIGSAAWKHWKKDHAKIDTMTLKDLSDSDLLELKFEAIDMLHFFMNFLVSLGMDSKEIFNMYFSKHQENVNRQNRGY